MEIKESKFFVGGYYDDRIFEGTDFEDKTPFSKDLDIYSLSEVLKLGFVEGVIENYESINSNRWDDLDYNEKVKLIMEYTDGDNIAGLKCFDSEEEAVNFKNSVISEIENIENNTVFDRQVQDNEGYFRDVYKLK